ncbi:uncharacterized protein [Clinocottus analis]|uniref:uncharacterized protein isoform X2 n=1 Tax=Clinocottus analis TaxID=304258 RepID=UPI0035C2624D
MSDLWPSPRPPSPPPPIMHHSSASQPSPFNSSPPPFFSFPSPRNHPQVTAPHLKPHPQVTAPHLGPHPQVTAPHLGPHPQVTAPHLGPHPQVTAPHLGPHPQVTAPHLGPHPQVTAPHLGPHPQVTAPHLGPHPQVTAPHLGPHPQVTAPHLGPHPQVTAPHLGPHPQVTAPHLGPHPQVTAPHLHQQHLYNQESGFNDPDWSRTDPPDLSYLFQSQTSERLEAQNHNQFPPSDTHQQEELEHLPFTSHTHLASGSYGAGDPCGPGPWRPAQLQRWSISSSTQCFHDGDAPQPFCCPTTPGPSPHYPQAPAFCSPTTPGPSPHYPQAPAFCSTTTPGLSPLYPQAPAFCSLGPHMHPGAERLDLHMQTPRQLTGEETLGCCLNEYDGHDVTSDPGQHLQHQTAGPLLLQRELIQDQPGCLDATERCFTSPGRGRDVGGAAQTSDWREDSGGGRRRGGRRGRGGRDTQKMKGPQPESIQKSRLLCTVCKRGFRSLPALNGHMRCHSGSKSAMWLNKREDPVSAVMPVSVPVRPRGQRRCRHPRGAAQLYCSLLHREEGADEDGEATNGEAAHYTPPPMLCPLRAGPGLYRSLATRRRPRVQTAKPHNNLQGLRDLVAVATSPPARTRINQPQINEGQPFQAEIPPLQVRKDADCDSHNALLRWTPRDELECLFSEQRALLAMACSSVVPGGGAQPEFALNVLSECKGDFLLTVQKLLSMPETSNDNHIAHWHPIVSWSAAERRLLVKSLQLHHKDFSRIQKDVQTKSVSQCVEFYYLWKRKMSLSARTPAGLTVSLPDSNLLDHEDVY